MLLHVTCECGLAACIAAAAFCVRAVRALMSEEFWAEISMSMLTARRR